MMTHDVARLKIHSQFVLLCVGLIASLTFCQRGPISPDTPQGIKGAFPACWEPVPIEPFWLPAKIVTEGEFPFTDVEIEAMISEWSTGRLTPWDIMQEIDKKTILQIESHIFGTGDFYRYGLSERYDLIYHDLITGNDRVRGYCSVEKNQIGDRRLCSILGSPLKK